MDASDYGHRAFLRRAASKSSSLAARSVRRADKVRENYGLVGLLRWSDLSAHSFGCVFHGLGRVLNDAAPSSNHERCLNNSTRRIPTDALNVDPVNDPSSWAEK